MVYFVFDMDATLANLYTVHYFLCDLRRETMMSAMPPPSDALQLYLDTAYTTFVRSIATREANAEPFGPQPLGILRPGILTVMRLLNSYKQSGFIDGVVIYSNNGALGTLHFIRDLIHAHVRNPKLICDCIHWGHEGRALERTNTPGDARKTWDVLKAILTNAEGPCKAPETLEPKDVYFVDDQMHPDLMQTLPHGHYIHVSPYEFKARYEPVAELYKQALEESGLLRNPAVLEEYFEYITEGCSKKKMTNINSIVAWYKTATRTPSGTHVPSPDKSIMSIVSAVRSLVRGGGRHIAQYKKKAKSRKRIDGRRNTRKAFR
jgi:hypothetical protein